ncbi:MAG: hypothetical protein R3E98_05240 [Gemmatimonadota bacterium]|nr:hypothetical protein [Gemmatimonadota bacterium]
MNPSPAPTTPEAAPSLRREFSQLLGLNEHLSSELELLRRELSAPLTRALLDSVGARSDTTVPTVFEEAARAIDVALAALGRCDAELHTRIRAPLGELHLDGIPALPPRLSRFLAERQDIPGFHYEVRRDRVRGWVVHWKEYGTDGALRGAGQFYERPYAWLED